MARLWALDSAGKAPEGKFLVLRRDGTIFRGPHFVIGPRDPAGPAALRAYAAEASRLGFDPGYCVSVGELAAIMAAHPEHGKSDPWAGPHRHDDAGIVYAMRHGGRIAIERPAITVAELDDALAPRLNSFGLLWRRGDFG